MSPDSRAADPPPRQPPQPDPPGTEAGSSRSRRKRPRPVVVLGVIGLGLIGVVLAVTGALVSRITVAAVGISWPAGLVYVLIVTVLVLNVAGLVVGKAGTVAAVAGWAMGLTLCLWPLPGGDVVIAADGTGMVFVVGGMIAGVVALLRSVHA